MVGGLPVGGLMVVLVMLVMLVVPMVVCVVHLVSKRGQSNPVQSNPSGQGLLRRGKTGCPALSYIITSKKLVTGHP